MKPNLQLSNFRSEETISGSDWDYRPTDYLNALVEFRLLEEGYEGMFGRRQVGCRQ